MVSAEEEMENDTDSSSNRNSSVAAGWGQRLKNDGGHP
jgi:hypothetical protein